LIDSAKIMVYKEIRLTVTQIIDREVKRSFFTSRKNVNSKKMEVYHDTLPLPRM